MRTPLFLSIVTTALLFSTLSFAQDVPEFEGPAPAPEPPAPPPPPEPAAPLFGEAGETVMTGDTAASFSSSHYDATEARSIAGGVSIDLRHFVVRGFALGVYLSVNASESRGYGADSSIVRQRTDLFSGAVTLSYNVPIGETLSWFPQVLLGVHRSHQSIAVISGQSASISASASGASDIAHTGPWVQIVLPVLLHPVPHFFIGVGPYLYRDGAAEVSDAAATSRRTSIGLDFQVGGWWGGPHVEGTRTTRAGRFGEADVFVLTNELGLAAGYDWFSGTDAWNAGVSFSPGLDVFVVPHVSLGGSAFVSHAEYVGFTGTTKVKTTRDSFSVGPRLGAELPITEWLSAYLRGGMTFGTRSFDAITANAQNKISEEVVRAYASLHAIVHVASHFLVGMGPVVAHDLASKDQYDRSNRQTTIGVSALVGGWF